MTRRVLREVGAVPPQNGIERTATGATVLAFIVLFIVVVAVMA